MNFAFKKATKAQSHLRMALIGPSGSGKTYSALAIATHLASPIAVIDTERGSASKYADLFAFDVLELTTFAPDTYCEAISAACKAGYKVVVIDSLSHAWMGKDGALEQVDRAAKRSSSGNSFTAWRDITPMHNRLVDALIGADTNIIVTMRTKTEYVLEKDERTGKTAPKKIGLAPVQRDGLEYEFDVLGDMNLDNEFIVGKTRCSSITGKVFPKPGKVLAEELRAWLSDGSPAPVPTRAPEPAAGSALAQTSKPEATTEPPKASPEQETTYESLAQKLTLAGSEIELKTAWQEVLHAAKNFRITLTMRAQLANFKDQRKDVIRRQVEAPQQALAGNEMPSGWGGEKPAEDTPQDTVGPCMVCGDPAAGTMIATQSNDGEIGVRHEGCSPFGLSASESAGVDT